MTGLLSLPFWSRTPTEPPNRPTAIPEYPGSKKTACRGKNRKKRPATRRLQRMVDREAKRAEGKGVGYDRWASLHNLKQMAATHNFLMENGIA